MKKLTEVDKLKYWLDAEISILHIMFVILMMQFHHSIAVSVILWLYLGYSIVYCLSRIAYVAKFDKDYLKIPKS